MATSKKAQGGKAGEKKPQANKDEEQANTITIKAVAKGGFYRCGMFFPHEGRTLKVDELSEQQLAQLKAEPNLVVAE